MIIMCIINVILILIIILMCNMIMWNKVMILM